MKFIMIVALAIGAFVYFNKNTVRTNPDIYTIKGDIFRVDDRDTDAYVEFRMSQQEEQIEGEVFMVAAASGAIEFQGRALIFSYLTGEGYKIFKKQFGGDIKLCRAGFLNSNTHVVHLMPKTSAMLEDLHHRFKNIKSGQESVYFKIKGHTLSFHEARAANGRAANVNYGGQRAFLVTDIVDFN